MKYIVFDIQEDALLFCDKMYAKIKDSIPKSDNITQRWDLPKKSESENKWMVLAPEKFDSKYDLVDKSKFITELPNDFIKKEILEPNILK